MCVPLGKKRNKLFENCYAHPHFLQQKSPAPEAPSVEAHGDLGKPCQGLMGWTHMPSAT